MDLDFQKQKQRIAELSDTELVSKARDPSLSATDHMLIEAEISSRGLQRRQIAPQTAPIKPRSRRGANFFSLFIFAAVLISIIGGILDDMGIDVIEWLRDFFGGSGASG